MKHLYTLLLLFLSISTFGQNCATITNSDGAAVTSTSPGVLTVDVPDNVSITDINVGVSVTHAFISDLSVTVMSPAGTTVILVLTNECGEANINTVFDDEGADIDCSNGLNNVPTAQPNGSLADFNSENAMGTWTLMVTDAVPLDDGTLNSFSLEYCTDEVLAIQNNTLANVSLFPNPTKDKLTFQLLDITEAKVTIYNLLGQQVKSQLVSNNMNSIDVSQLTSGIFMVNLETKDGSKTSKKFIKN